MAELTVARVYGNSLYQVATESGKQEELLAEAKEVLRVFDEQPELREFTKSLVIPSAAKKKMLREVFEGSVSQEILNLMYVMVDKGRMAHFPRTVDVFDDLVNHEQGVLHGTVISAVALSDNDIARLNEQTSKLFRQPVELANEVKPQVLGGVEIFVEGKVIDATLKTRLEKLRDIMSL